MIPLISPQRADWFSDWVRILTAQRLDNYAGDSRAEREAIVLVQRAFLPRLGSARVDERTVIEAWRGTLGMIIEKGSDPETAFFATRFTHWMGGLSLGCCAGLNAWISTRPAHIHESEVASQITRMQARDRLRAEQSPVHREAYARLLKRMGYEVHDVASIGRVTDDLIKATKAPPPEQIVACDYVWHFMGALHEGAWMTLGMIRNSHSRD